MHGRELVKAAIRGEKVERTPWVPFTGCHAGALIGVKAGEFLRSPDLVVQGLEAAIKRYRPDGLPVMFDLQIEAEILGCRLVWADENPPAVASHPLAEGVRLAELRAPRAAEGRIPVALEACRRLRAARPELALYGLITGPFTLAMHLLGTDIFMKMFDAPDEVKRLMEFCRQTCQAMAGYYMDAGCDVIAVVDPMTSQIGPEQFNEFVTPFVAPVFDAIRANNCLGSFFVCGQAQQNVEAMCACRPDNVSVDENIPLDFVRDVCRARQVSFGGNLQLTVVLLLGTPEESQRNALACLEIGGNQGFVLAPGCDLPYATPPANLEAVAEIVHDAYRREVLRTMARTEKVRQTLNMREYGQTDKVIVDIITLDSEACAPCQYMVEAVRSVAPHFEGIVEWREHKIKHKESLVFMTSLMVKNIPTICIDGHIAFVSRIPRREELVAAIQARINEKLRGRIQRRRASLLVMAKTAEEAAPALDNVNRAVRELGAESEIHVEFVNDERRMLTYGVTHTPAVVLVRYQLKSAGAPPEVLAVKEWIKDV